MSGRSRSARLAVLVAAVGLVTMVTTGVTADAAAGAPGQTDRAAAAARLNLLVPQPVLVRPSATAPYRITPATAVWVPAGSAEARAVGEQLAGLLRRSTGYPLPVWEKPAGSVAAIGPGIELRLAGLAGLGDEGYQLDAAPGGVVIRAAAPAGLFHGVQTLRQLLPPAAESDRRQPGPWLVPAGHVVDHPRYAYRGAMLDVARHFFGVADVEHYIDEISLYKINYLLHLSDDQGWRIAIDGWPRLASYGGGTEVGGGPGGYYTQGQFRQLVAYARAHFVTIVPEIDGPGHTNAALASYAELNCDGVAPPRYTGIDVGFSSLCVSKPVTYTFLRDVLDQLARLSPGPYLHIGGDEAHSTRAADYATFEGRELPIVADTGKAAMAWHDIAKVNPPTSTVLEFWGTTGSDQPTAAAAARGNRVVMAPANRAYLDQKYDPSTRLGLNWAGYIEERDAYDWDPGSYLGGVTGPSVLGVEAPLWSETLVTMANIEYLAFPRLPAIAELGWSPRATHDWNSFAERLGAQGPMWTVMGINFHASPQVPWAPGTRGGTD
ncbi:beta-N-acetylhexosaminidase [Gandjariella thermophila]|nr:beta-N-acetylhexosaminidase [Gandjariella thermophila]